MKIEISKKLYQRMQKLSIPLVDTEESLISRILDSYEVSKIESNKHEDKINLSKITQDDLIPFLIFVLKENGGKLKKRVVEKKVYNILKDFLSEEWYTDKVSNNVQRWVHNLAWAKERAKKRGLIKNPEDSGFGYWELTKLGNNISLGPTIKKQINSIEIIKKIRNDFDLNFSKKPFQENNYSEFKDLVKKRFEHNENLKIIINNILIKGKNFDENDEPERALECYTAAINYDPLNTDAYYARAEINEELGNISEAIKDYKKIIEINPPEDAEFYVSLGLLCSDIKDDLSAIIYYSKAIEIKPDEADLFFFRASVHERMGNIERAFMDANFALSIEPNEFTYNQFVNNLKRKL
jgi:tetratricopeptide (TPR) repeat protein